MIGNFIMHFQAQSAKSTSTSSSNWFCRLHHQPILKSWPIMQNGQKREILKKKQFYIAKSSLLEGKTFKILNFFITIWIGIKSWSIMQNAVKKWEIIPSYIEICHYNAIFGQKYEQRCIEVRNWEISNLVIR